MSTSLLNTLFNKSVSFLFWATETIVSLHLLKCALVIKALNSSNNHLESNSFNVLTSNNPIADTKIPKIGPFVPVGRILTFRLEAITDFGQNWVKESEHFNSMLFDCYSFPNEAIFAFNADKMAVIFQTIFSNAFSELKICEFRVRFR